MPMFTPEQWIVLFLVLLVGWILGLLSRRSGGRLRREYERERADWRAREEADAARYRAASGRIAELEREAPVIGAGTGAAVGAAAAGRRDDLSLIRSVGRTGETRLNEIGVYRYRDITDMSPAEEAALEGRLGLEPGLIADEAWREQASLLAAGRIEDHRKRFGTAKSL